ncbi:general odorant-binding protein 45-like [Toxorhynchites rutilus septentrionalis]|uniref:general odorant-binding protein 45-like n=1 Tax=Toxorhynchites rutilus septentrionalis TaxID=329112 RepID=UPI00247892BD|nr:general odorant-binding protein 45-like [Toxorhynchites rutilus septentrionalis]
MLFFPSLAIVTLTVVTIASGEHWKSPNFKSLATARQECALYLHMSNDTIGSCSRNGYPDEPKIRNLVHCMLINVNAWDENNKLKQHVLKNFFKPTDSDTCYENRTRDCLEKIDLPHRDTIGRAYSSFLCYYRQYGNVVEEEQFIPYRDNTRRQLMTEALAIENVPRHVLEKISEGKFLDLKEAPNLVFTYTVRTGFYEPPIGTNFGRLYTQHGVPELLNEAQCCEATIRRQYYEEPTRAYQTFKQCVSHLVSTLEMVKSVAKDLLKAPKTPYCGSCGSPAPYGRYGSSTCNICGRSNDITTGKPRGCYYGQC